MNLLLDTHAMVLALGQRLQEEFGLRLEQIDLGGGLGVPYAPEETPLALTAFGTGLSELLQRHPWFQGELILEPGRFLAAPCGVYLARVIRVKESRGERFAILEGGINHLLRPLLTGQAFPVKAIGKLRRPATTDWRSPVDAAVCDNQRCVHGVRARCIRRVRARIASTIGLASPDSAD